MADDRTKVGGRDRQRINIHEGYELAHWSKRFSVSKETLKRAVAKVGDRAEDVEKELKSK